MSLIVLRVRGGINSTIGAQAKGILSCSGSWKQGCELSLERIATRGRQNTFQVQQRLGSITSRFKDGDGWIPQEMSFEKRLRTGLR